MWIGKMLLLFQGLVKEVSESRELAFVPQFLYVLPLPEGDVALRCMRRQWATIGFVEGGHDIDKEGKSRDTVAAGECHGTISSESIVSTGHVVLANNAVHPFTKKLP